MVFLSGWMVLVVIEGSVCGGRAGPGSRRRTARRAQPAEDDLRGAHLEAEVRTVGDRQAREVDDQVAHTAAAPAHQVVVGVIDGLGRRVGLVALQDPEDALALGRHLASG